MRCVEHRSDRPSATHVEAMTLGLVVAFCGTAAAWPSATALGQPPSEPPVAPLPEDLPDGRPARLSLPEDRTLMPASAAGQDPAVRPATAPPPPGGLSEPVPLGESSRPLGPAAAPLRPVADWSVLAAILGAFGVLAIFRFRSARRERGLPVDVFEVLGSGSLGGQHGVRVVRFGPRTLLVGVSSTGSQTLAEIDDQAVTDRIVAACLARTPARVQTPVRRSGSRPATAAGEVA
jgi:flagellar biogenesis protein FliO